LKAQRWHKEDDEASLMPKIEKLPNKKKQALLPKVGAPVILGRAVYRVSYVNEGRLRFTATLTGIKKKEEEEEEERE